MKEFGLDETVLSEEEMLKRRQRLKTLITLGKTRGYLTHAEITDHLPEKLVDAETLEVVVAMLNDLGVAVYEQTPDAEMLLLNNTDADGGDRRGSRRRSRSRPVHRGQRVRPHHRPGAHVHARDGHRGTAHARRRNRDRQAHRRRPDGHDGGDLRLARPPSPRSCAWPTRSAKAGSSSPPWWTASPTRTRPTTTWPRKTSTSSTPTTTTTATAAPRP